MPKVRRTANLGRILEAVIDTNPATRQAVELLGDAFARYQDEFGDLTRAVTRHFAAGDWPALDAATQERLLLYPRRINELVVRLGQLSHTHTLPWAAIRRRYQAAIEARLDQEIAGTFYNSAIRRLRGTIGVDEDEEILDLSTGTVPEPAGARSASAEGVAGLAAVVAEALRSLGWRWADRDGDARRVADRLLSMVRSADGVATFEWFPAGFVRRQRAYLIGRYGAGGIRAPIVIGLGHSVDGVRVTALVSGPDAASIVFSFTRSYFHVDVEAPRGMVGYLRSLMPSKRLDELYTAVGYHRHGKREFYQALHRALADPAVRFDPIDGVPGLVMLAFVLKPLNVVFKVIRDRAGPPKQVTRKEVMAKYEFVFRHEHGGRLADTQEFTGLSVPARSFPSEVLTELLREASESVSIGGDRVIFGHVYTERRMTPLDVFLRQASPGAAREAVLDFGRALKDLAGLDLFPGDLLPKNFGVTRHGRVVFYDYDEISTLSECRFRTIPAASRYDDEMSAEPWFSVGPADVFPEEWERFIRFPDPLHRQFLSHHADVFTAGYWNAARERVRSEGLVDPPPFREGDWL